MKELYVHIGYPKTATTVFQKHLFSNHSEIQNITNNDLLNIKDVFYSRENTLKRNILQYENYLKQIFHIGNKYIYSNESFLSFSMFFRFKPRPYIWTLEPNSIARKIKHYFIDTKVFDKVYIIITIRKQADLLKSMYSQVYNLSYRHFRETKSFKKFLDYSLENNKGFIIDTLHYYNIVKTYEELFGTENVKVMVYEQLKNNQSQFLKNLTDFMKIDIQEATELLKNKKENTKNKESNFYASDTRDLLTYLKRYKNKYIRNSLYISKTKFYHTLKKINIGGKKINVEIPPNYKEKIETIFKETNKALDEEYKLGLKQYGYY